jgi:hypothetical protein
MIRRVAYWTASIALVALVAGCGFFRFEERPAWRNQVENACLQSGEVVASEFIQPQPAIRGPRICGLQRPFKVSALEDGAVIIKPTATLGCPMVAGLQRWIANSVQPAALEMFGVDIAAIQPLGSYGCRPVDNIRGKSLSDHSFGNAIDVGFFILADGRKISVEKGWKSGTPAEQAFLRTVFVGACETFYTVLGPGSDSYHYNHFHLDLRLTNAQNGRHYCRPVMKMPAPVRDYQGVPMSMGPGALDPTRTGSITRR